MTDDTPDYASYSLSQLEDVRQHVNREKFPDRYAMVVAEIEKRRVAGVEEDDLSSEQLRHNRKSHWGSVLLFIISAYLFVFGVLAPLISTYESRNWRETPCVLGRASDESSKGQRKKIVFTYVVAGQTYSGYRLDPADTKDGSYGGKHSMRIYPPGKKIVCFVNPRDPREAVLNKSLDFWDLLIFLGMCAIGFRLGVDGLRTARQVETNN